MSDRSVEPVAPSFISEPSGSIGEHTYELDGYIIRVSTPSGVMFGRITLSPSGAGPMAIWLLGSIIGQCYREDADYSVFPIRDGLLESEAVRINPLDFLVREYEESAEHK